MPRKFTNPRRTTSSKPSHIDCPRIAKKHRVDPLTPAERSHRMSLIKGKNTKIELIIQSSLRERKLRFKKHVSSLPGKPDVVFEKAKVAVFVDGNFWHGYAFDSWKHKMAPFWQQKIQANIRRDRRNFQRLRRSGWKVIRIWEQAARKNLEREIGRIESALANRVV